MTVKELIQELSECDPTLNVKIVVSVSDCTGHHYVDSRCYCGYSDNEYSVSVNKETKFNKKTEKQDVTAIVLRGD